jgi:uncharacterized protein YjbJ (UPF0337 family)
MFGTVVATLVARLLVGRGKEHRPMTDQHVKGAVSTVEGTVKEVAGKVTGDKKLEVEGKVQKIQGKAQDSLGDVQDAVENAVHPRADEETK